MALLPDTLTPLTHDELITVLLSGFPIAFGRAPKQPAELSIYYAQCLMENGAKLGSLHCYNLGNVKANADWGGATVLYDCDETVSADLANHARAMGPCELVTLPSGKVRVTCHPPHPWCMFRAFSSPEQGAAGYLRLFALTRYVQAALRAEAGDAIGFVLAAKAGGYFTSPNITSYAVGVESIARHARPQCAAAMAGQQPAITDADRDRIMGIVALSLDDQIRGEAEPFPLRDA